MGVHYDLVIFDMDGVLTKVRSCWGFVHQEMGVNNEDSLKAFIDGEIDDEEFIRRDVKLWMDRDPEFGDKDLIRILRNMPLIDGIQETVACLKYNNMKTVICSGGLWIATEMIKNDYEFDDCAAVELVKDENGHYTGESIRNVTLMDKGIRTEQFIRDFGTTPERTVSIGNSYTDIKMLEKTGLKIAFNPIDDETIKAADHVVRSSNISDVLDIILEVKDRD